MSRSTTGWVLVAIQFLLLVALVALPDRSDWSTPLIVHVVGYVFMIGGAILVLAASSALGRSLTPTPVPAAHGKLATTGLYRWMRHPIYSGVLTIVIGVTVRSGSVITVIVAVATFAFFVGKASWEEGQLAEHYPSYAEYAASTPRFVPRLRLDG